MLRYFYMIEENKKQTIKIMEKQQFKTNVKCGACVAAITAEMDKLDIQWKVDLTHVDRILTVEGDVSKEKIEMALEKSGYKGEPVS